MKLRKSMLRQTQRGVFITALSFSVLSCGQNKKNGMMTNGAPEYAVMTVDTSAVDLNTSYSAKLRGKQDIEIRPNVSGFITKLCVDEGATVKKGQTLFIIDPVQYEEAVKVAEAAVNVAKANVATAELTAENKRELARKNIISQYDLQTAENSLASQKANLAQAEAQLINARKNLSYTRVTSPSNGVVGKIPFRVGSLVGPTTAVALTTVADVSEIIAYFSLNEKEVMALTKNNDGKTSKTIEEMPEVELQLPDGSIYPYKGKIITVSGIFDDATGSASVRAAFPNKENLLRSGGSGVVLIPEKDNEALVIPQNAVSEIQDKRYVFVVTDSSTVAQTEIQVLSINDGQQFVVTSGLKPGDRIVTEGVGTTVRNNMKITPITPEQAKAKLQGAIQQATGSAK